MEKNQIDKFDDVLGQLDPAFLMEHENVVKLINAIMAKFIEVTLSQKGMSSIKMDTVGIQEAEQRLSQEHPEFEEAVRVILKSDARNLKVIIQRVVDRFVDVTTQKDEATGEQKHLNKNFY
jgi:hypothetical protein